jgi:hypothetical protein
MQVTAKVIEVLEQQTGMGKNGEWKKQDFILETDDQYPKKICISVWGDKIDSNQLQIGNQLKVDFDAESREFNGKWFTNLKAWKIEILGVSTSTKQSNDKVVISSYTDAEMVEDSLPF